MCEFNFQDVIDCFGGVQIFDRHFDFRLFDLNLFRFFIQFDFANVAKMRTMHQYKKSFVVAEATFVLFLDNRH